MEMKGTKGAVLTAAAIAGLSTGLLLTIKFDTNDGLKMGMSSVSVGVSQAQSQCACCNDSGSGTCAGR
jgi:hypothetical protein